MNPAHIEYLKENRVYAVFNTSSCMGPNRKAIPLKIFRWGSTAHLGWMWQGFDFLFFAVRVWKPIPDDMLYSLCMPALTGWVVQDL